MGFSTSTGSFPSSHANTCEKKVTAIKILATKKKKLTKVCMVNPTTAAFDSYAPGGSHERFGSGQRLGGHLPFCC